MSKRKLRERGRRGQGSVFFDKRRQQWVSKLWSMDELGRKKPEVKRFGKDQEREARLYHEEQLVASRKGQAVRHNGLRVEKFLDDWIELKETGKTRTSTIESYRGIIERHIKPYIGKKMLSELKRSNVLDMIEGVWRNTKSTNLCHESKKVLSSALTYAIDRELIFHKATDFINMREYEYKPKQYRLWNEKELVLFLEEAQRATSYYVAMVVNMTTPLRRGEILGLRWRDIDFEHNILTVSQQLTVNGIGPTKESVEDGQGQVIELNKAIVDILLSVRPVNYSAEDLIFLTGRGTPISPRNYTKRFREIRKKLGLPYCTPHKLRHLVLTYGVLKFGVSTKTASYAAGHTTAKTTERIYIHGMTEGTGKISQGMVSILKPSLLVRKVSE